MDFADRLDMMDDDCDIEGFPMNEYDCTYFIPNRDIYPLCRNYDCHDYGKCSRSENMIDEGGLDYYDR